MSSTDRLFKLAERFSRKISLAQQTAQKGEIQSVLEEAKLWGTYNDLFPVADEANMPSGVPVQFNIIVDSGLNVLFRADPSKAPPAAVIKMCKLLKDKFGDAMQQALKTITIKERNPDGSVKSQRPVTVTGTVTIPWHSLK